MAGTTLDRELTLPKVEPPSFGLATPADDAACRRLLRENPMPGAISISLEREPDFFADAAQPGEARQTIVAREHGRIVCIGTCAVRLRFVNGEARRVGYLGGLRLDADCAGRFDILRQGYACFRELQEAAPADYYFTSIAADNYRARRLLERNRRGLPAYEFIGEFVTLLLSTKSNSAFRADSAQTPSRIACADDVPQLATTLNQHNRSYQLAAHWTEAQLRALVPLGLRAEDFFGGGSDESSAVTALWDQRGFRQTVIRGYSSGLAFLRPAYNLCARLVGRPQLPAPGTTLSVAVTPAFTAVQPADACKLTAQLQAVANRRGIALLTLGFAPDDPRLNFIRQHFRCREYRSRMYLVRWPGLGGAAAELDGRILSPEVALL